MMADIDFLRDSFFRLKHSGEIRFFREFGTRSFVCSKRRQVPWFEGSFACFDRARLNFSRTGGGRSSSRSSSTRVISRSRWPLSRSLKIMHYMLITCSIRRKSMAGFPQAKVPEVLMTVPMPKRGTGRFNGVFTRVDSSRQRSNFNPIDFPPISELWSGHTRYQNRCRRNEIRRAIVRISEVLQWDFATKEMPMMLRSFMKIQSTMLAISNRDDEIGVSSRLPHGCPLGDIHRCGTLVGYWWQHLKLGDWGSGCDPTSAGIGEDPVLHAGQRKMDGRRVPA